MKALKAAIVIMGVLIVVGVAVLVAELIKRSNDPEHRAAAEDRPAAATTTPAATALGLPAGARIADMVPVGNRLVVRVVVPDREERLYVLDPRTGAVTVALSTGEPTAIEEAMQ